MVYLIGVLFEWQPPAIDGMDAAQALNFLGQCYQALRSADNAAIAQSTEVLSQFYTQNQSVPLHIEFLKGMSDPITRRHAIIGLSRSLSNLWDEIPNQQDVFIAILHAITHEVDWLNRQNLISIIRMIINDGLKEALLGFDVQCAQSGNDAFLEIALLTCCLIPIDPANEGQMVPFVSQMLERGFGSGEPLVRLAAFHYVVNSDYCLANVFFEKFPVFWGSVIEMFPAFISNTDLPLPKLVDLFVKAIQEQIIPGYPDPLLMMCVSSYPALKASGAVHILDQLHSIIKKICKIYGAGVLEAQRAQDVIGMYFDWSCSLYQSTDSYSVSGATVFEKVVKYLSKAGPLVPALWEAIQGLVSSEPGSFVAIRTIGVTLCSDTSFYQDKFPVIEGLLQAAFQSSSSLLREAAATTVQDILQCQPSQREEFSMRAIPVVLESCKTYVSADILDLCSELLGNVKNTDDMFDDVCIFLMNCLDSGAPDVQYSSLRCISSLSQGSRIKSVARSQPIIEKLVMILGSATGEEPDLKTPAVDCIATLAKTTEIPVGELIGPLFGLLTASEKSDPNLTLSCWKAIDALVWHHPEESQAATEEILLGVLGQRIELDISQAYAASLVEDEPLSTTEFDISAACLELFPKLAIKYQQFLEGISNHLFACYDIHKLSPSTPLKVAVAKSIEWLIDAVEEVWERLLSHEQVIQNVQRICGVLFSMFNPGSDMEVLCEVIRAYTKVIACLGYDTVQPTDLGNFIGTMREIVVSLDTETYEPVNSESDFFEAIYPFAIQLCTCYQKNDPVACLVEPFVGFLQCDNAKFRCPAIQFLGEVAVWDDKPDFIMTVIQAAMQLADQEVDSAPFLALSKLIRYKKKLIEPAAPQLLAILMKRLGETYPNSERIMRFRDACVTCCVKLVLEFFDDPVECNSDVTFPAILSALPLSMDFDGIEDICRFFEIQSVGEKLHESFKTEFLTVLVGLFANSENYIRDEMCIDIDNVRMLLMHLAQLMQEIPNSQEAVKQIVGNDEVKLANVMKKLL